MRDGGDLDSAFRLDCQRERHFIDSAGSVVPLRVLTRWQGAFHQPIQFMFLVNRMHFGINPKSEQQARREA